MIFVKIIKHYHTYDDNHSFDHDYADAENEYDRPHNHDHETNTYEEDGNKLE